MYAASKVDTLALKTERDALLKHRKKVGEKLRKQHDKERGEGEVKAGDPVLRRATSKRPAAAAPRPTSRPTFSRSTAACPRTRPRTKSRRNERPRCLKRCESVNSDGATSCHPKRFREIALDDKAMDGSCIGAARGEKCRKLLRSGRSRGASTYHAWTRIAREDVGRRLGSRVESCLGSYGRLVWRR